MKRYVAPLATIVLGIGLAVAPVGSGQATPNEKVVICHATSSRTNPYTTNNVDTSSIDEQGNKYLNGHGDHTGPVFPAANWGDIIPPFTSPSGTSFPGLNWTPAGQAIYQNGCSIPPETTLPAPTDPPVTTVAPTTVAPTTVAPTTVAPTTVAPTTVAPTTVAPTTVAPTTVAPTTVAPTTVAPTTVAPTTEPSDSTLPAPTDPTTTAPGTTEPTGSVSPTSGPEPTTATTQPTGTSPAGGSTGGTSPSGGQLPVTGLDETLDLTGMALAAIGGGWLLITLARRRADQLL